MNNWKEITKNWLSRKRSFIGLENDVLNIFQTAFENTLVSEKSWFGFPKSRQSLSLTFGRIYLIGIFNRTIEILIDMDLKEQIDFNTRLVSSSVSNGQSLYWVTTDIKNIPKLISNKLIWKHYKLATLKVNNYPNIKWERKDWLEGKYLLSDLINYKAINDIDYDSYKQTFELELEKSLSASSKLRRKRLNKAPKKPLVSKSYSTTFIRNPDVVAEILEGANGFCEYCEKEAPFKKDTNKNGFLEVHHIIPLSENGFDTVENAVALCPNCHRHAHYGKKTFDIEKLKKDGTQKQHL